MKIKSIELKNGYKRFHHLTIDLGEQPARIIALVGSNGCGKSSVFDGMLMHAHAHGQIGGTGGKPATYHSMNDQPNYNHQNIEIIFDVGKYGQVRTLKTSMGKEQTIFSFRSPYRYNSNLKITSSQATPEIRLNNYGASSAADIDSKMEDNYRRLYVRYNKYLNENDCKPSEAKKKIIGDLNKSIQACLNLSISSIGDIESNQGTIYFTKPDHPKDFEFNVLSSGEKEVVDILLDLYLRQNDYNDTVYIIDEPELHVSTSIQKKLLLEINNLIPENCQIWIATHSIGFLRALQDELKHDCQLIYFRDNVDWAKTSITLKPEAKSRTTWKEIFSVALDDLTELISPKKIIYCEGKDIPSQTGGERGLDARVYNNIFGEDYPDVLFVSSGGNTELDQRSDIALAILSKVFSELEILVLKDMDVSPEGCTSMEARRLYLENNNQNHRMLKRREIENYLYDKDVLIEFCSRNVSSFNEQAYDELVTDITSQNLKDVTGAIKRICGITTSISSERFKENLSCYLLSHMPAYSELEECVFNQSI